MPATARSTMTRLAAVQRWPVVPNADQTMPSVARSRSASARTTIAFLPPSSRDSALERGGPRVRDAAAGLGVAGEADDRHVRAFDDRVTDLAAGAGHEVDGPGREARLDHAARRGASRSAGVSLEGLNTTVLPVTSGRHHLPARDRHREVPGRDDPGDADRLADAHRPLVGQLRRRRVAEHPAALAGHEEGDVDALLDIAASLGQDLAHLAGHRPREALLVLGHQRPEAVQDLAALGCRGASPGGDPRPRRL